ncbi:MAG: protein kinase [Bryobacteraceae bacterium]|nr:protein kinase [Bryobacteraceae bacterium]
MQALIGKGGSGLVYRALDTDLRRTVALKILAGDADDPGSRRRLLQEAELASSLNHPNIVTVHEVGLAGPHAFIAMEFLEGGTLRQRLKPGGLPRPQLFSWAIQIADALSAAHEAGIVHRDLKPGNVMISARGAAKVVDFGLAKGGPREGDEQAEETRTLEGYISGTSGYMAPEQAEGKPVDARTDIFAFGCVLYEMATGASAFGAASPAAALANVLRNEPPPLRTLAPHTPPALERLIETCLRKDPATRWRSAADLRLMLELIEKDAAQPAPAAVVQSPPRHRAWQAVALLALLLAGALAGALYWKSRSPAGPPRTRTIALTADTGLTIAPSLSADGRLVAYASDRAGGSLDIWVQQIGGRAPIRVTSDPADETDPHLSPDGTRIVFRSQKNGGSIWIVPALGGEPMLLVQGGRNPRFSPDGKYVAYWTGRDGSRLASGRAHAWVIPAGGGQPEPLGGALSAAGYPLWSPAGDAALVLGRRSADLTAEPVPDWYLVPFPKGDPTPLGTPSLFRADRLSVPLTQYHILPSDWTSGPEGSSIVFSARTGDAVNLWELPMDGRRPAGPPTRITSGSGSDSYAAATANRLAFADTSLQFDLWAIPAGAPASSPLQRLTDDLSWEFFPSLSRDASKVAYVTARSGSNALCIRDLASGRETILLSAGRILSPILSGDGATIAFLDNDDQLSRIATQGGAASTICRNCGSPVDISFDGRRVLVEPFDSPEDIREIDLAGGKPRTLVPAREALYSGHLSRDGSWVVFNAVKSQDATQLYVARVENGKAAPPDQWVPVSDGRSVHQGPQWAPDENRIYYLSERDGLRCVWSQRLDPTTKKPLGEPEAVRHFHEVRRSFQHLRSFDDRTRLAVGGSVVVVALGELRGNIWLRETLR